MYTDGITDVFNDRGKILGIAECKSSCIRHLR